MTIINIRGTNGSGKTTLARRLITDAAQPVDLIWYDAPTKRDPARKKSVEGWGTPGGFLAVGSYKQGCGGLDTVPNFELQQNAVRAAAWWERPDGKFFLGEPPEHVVCEGVLASTVAGSWLETFSNSSWMNGHDVLVAYLDTPVELCLERIRERQIAVKGEAREIKADLVHDKVRSIEATRPKFEAAGIRTVTLRHDQAYEDLLAALSPAARYQGII